MKSFFHHFYYQIPHKGLLMLLLVGILSLTDLPAQHSVARQWNEVLLQSIREDLARPTVHARNLFHVSIAMYDSWAAYDDVAVPYLLGRVNGDFYASFRGVTPPADVKAAQEEAMSYAAYRVLSHRFRFSANVFVTAARIDSLFNALGYDKDFESTDYESGSPAALGNYIGSKIIEFGLQDGANEDFLYTNNYYEPVNDPLKPVDTGNSELADPNRWQPLTLREFIDQSGNLIPVSSPAFLSPEWGNVVPFAMGDEDMTVYERDGDQYQVFKDPGAPPYLDMQNDPERSALYKWGFSLVAVWGSHLDPSNEEMVDISPGAIGNINSFPEDFDDYDTFYDLFGGGDTGRGYSVNPVTGEPYQQQLVKRGDYARVLAEFWADGPDSETPPGHWFSILNYVNDHEMFEKRYKGEGEILDDLEWDVKAYFAMGGTVHDAAVAAWSVKGWYDYIRPISAIRWMADQGQSSDENLPSYNENGIPLYEGFIELIEEGDPLAGANGENINKIKLYSWKGPDYIDDPETDVAGVGWILAGNWWPYQRPTFVTPPFAGYVSGHSTYSRAAAELMTLLTGDEYFPGGVGEFVAKKDNFLVFERGPSEDVVLQWATYRDASDQCSLSRIWGGIHPPADDINGRKMGIDIGVSAFEKADQFFNGDPGEITNVPELPELDNLNLYPNPVVRGEILTLPEFSSNSRNSSSLYDSKGALLNLKSISSPDQNNLQIETSTLNPGLYFIKTEGQPTRKFIVK